MNHFILQIQAGVAQTTQSSASISLWKMLVNGGWSMWIIMSLIALLSIMAVYFFFERYFAISRAGKTDADFMNTIRDLVYDYKLDAAKTLCKNSKTPVAKMIEKGLQRIGKPITEIERTVENAGKFEVSKLEKNLRILGIIAGIAPMLGFIGTIMGVIVIFFNISVSNNFGIAEISGGLYVKMLTSAAGLIVGIMAYTGYHYLNILLDKVIFKLEDNGIEFIDILQKEA